MVIAPGTLLNILHNVPLDTSYDHTLYFTTKEAQYSYFNSLAKYRAVNYTYVRYNDGIIRVGYKADDLYDCNYIMFQNTNFGNKWFYGYIKTVNYVSNDVAEITFEIDVIQTWLFDFEPDFCFVERTHTVSDAIGEHIEPEGVEIGEYILNTYEEITTFTKMDVILGICDVSEGAGGRVYDGIFSGAQLWAFKDTDFTGINAKINQYAQSPDSVTIMYICPNRLINEDDSDPPDGGILIPYTIMGREFTYTPANGNVTPTTAIDGYFPKNQKLHTYPYCFYHVDNGNGAELSLRYEFFTNGQVNLKIGGTIVQPVQIILNPMNYKMWSGAANTVNKTLAITLNAYPMCSWNMDSYKAWVAQNSVPMAVNTGVGLVNAIGSALATQNPLVGAANFVGNALNLTANAFTQVYQASIAADICKGNANSNNVNVSLRESTFYGGRCTISAEYARSIDDYFSKFGYAVKRLMKPIYNARPHWTYIKTIGCTVTGSVPCDDMKAICGMFDRGITFWMNGNEVGNYSLNNGPTV